ncbi:UDP-3-O-(3-hydroxymyristoyl)glucosamine N-acyltransferase [Crateriforma conspicua]|uniref:UDP-3-O-acylglucosamine N-acyltransferase n=1 Tax=Crateriforma conspicua TaxID=2527996 RepID=A0A5C5YBR6_9PLAN|nr:UDP-3-O-(3-hydroxymyristoyl)glucosamine N-acyltransferase [Crateriforma conspicua]TWT72233.1 UDP-3-O-acylglucosamine N-acyltransferase [Crateriforma conspicua]
MTISISDLAAMVGGKLIGDPSRMITGANPPAECQAGQITLLDEAKRAEEFDPGCAAAVVTPVALADGMEAECVQIVVEDPHEAFGRIVAHFRPPLPATVPQAGIDPDAQVDPTAEIHPTATVAAGTFIGARVRIMPGVVVGQGCTIDEDCVLHAGVVLYSYTRLEPRVVLHAGSVLGAHGFGYRQENGRHVPTAQLGYVHIERDVELGACVTVDRGTYGATRICEGTKVDNQVMIGHNCRIGRHNLICSQVGIAGSCHTGDYVVLAGQVGLKDHIKLGDQTIVGAQAGVMEDSQGHEVLLGSPATGQREQMQIMATERKLPEMRRELKSLRKELSSLRQIVGDDAPVRKAA